MRRGALETLSRAANPLRSASLLDVVCLSATLLLVSGVAFAEPTSKKAVRRSQPARTPQTAPDTTGTIAKQYPPSPKPQQSELTKSGAPQDEPIPPPIYLPNVSRAQMRVCGETWHAKKMEGSTGDDDWRDFAFKCLGSKNVVTAR